MKITIVSQGKYPGTFKITPAYNGVEFVKPSKKCATGLEVGKSYEANLFKPDDKKTVYVTEAELVGGEATDTPPAPAQAEVKPETKKAEAPVYKKAQEVTENLPASIKGVPSDKMTKADWANKDLGIKWLACIKASAVFNAQRPSVDILKVISDATALFYAQSDTQTEPKETTDDVNNPYDGL